jgi:hypothetical protein
MEDEAVMDNKSERGAIRIICGTVCILAAMSIGLSILHEEAATHRQLLIEMRQASVAPAQRSVMIGPPPTEPETPISGPPGYGPSTVMLPAWTAPAPAFTLMWMTFFVGIVLIVEGIRAGLQHAERPPVRSSA